MSTRSTAPPTSRAASAPGASPSARSRATRSSPARSSTRSAATSSRPTSAAPGSTARRSARGGWPTSEPAVLITGYPVDARLPPRRARRRRSPASATLVETFSTLRRPGSAALSIAQVAAGWADAACGFGVNPWDVTAAILILRQAGGHYRPLRQGKVPRGRAGPPLPRLRRHRRGRSTTRRSTEWRTASPTAASRPPPAFPQSADPHEHRHPSTARPRTSTPAPTSAARWRFRRASSPSPASARRARRLPHERAAGLPDRDRHRGGAPRQGTRSPRPFPPTASSARRPAAAAARDTWVVDPIDGTANFARGIPHFCISIAFVRDGAIEIGAIYNPALDELYFARRGHGATRNGTPIHVAPTDDFASACVELGWSTRDAERSLPRGDGRSPRPRRQRAARRVGRAGARLCRGRPLRRLCRAAHERLGCLAGLLLVKEAGGRVGPYLQARRPRRRRPGDRRGARHRRGLRRGHRPGARGMTAAPRHDRPPISLIEAVSRATASASMSAAWRRPATSRSSPGTASPPW